MYLFQQIEEITLSYRDTRKNIAEFVLNEKDKVLKMSMQDFRGLSEILFLFFLLCNLDIAQVNIR